METSLEVKTDGAVLEQVIIGGDLARLTPPQRVKYYRDVCASLGLNPLTKPFAYITLNHKLVLYAQRDCTDQLRSIKGISVKLMETKTVDDVYIVRAQATDRSGRVDESTGAVSIAGLKGDNMCNALMKAETKAKRRVTLSICGLGLMDETEISTMQGARPISDPDVTPPAPRRVDPQVPAKPPATPPAEVYDAETGEVVETEPTAEQKAEWEQVARFEAWGNETIKRIEKAIDGTKIDAWLTTNRAKLEEARSVAPDVAMAIVTAADMRKKALGGNLDGDLG